MTEKKILMTTPDGDEVYIYQDCTISSLNGLALPVFHGENNIPDSTTHPVYYKFKVTESSILHLRKGVVNHSGYPNISTDKEVYIVSKGLYSSREILLIAHKCSTGEFRLYVIWQVDFTPSTIAVKKQKILL